jgi:hypothetical protein
MPEKDEFTFDDNDDFPETDLSGAFADAEQEAPELSSAPEFTDESETPAAFDESDELMAEEVAPAKTKGGGGSKNRTLLLALLLVVVAAAAYYFMGFGGGTSEAPAPPPKSKQVVAVPPPQPVKAPVAPAKPAPSQPAVVEKADKQPEQVPAAVEADAKAAAKVEPVAPEKEAAATAAAPAAEEDEQPATEPVVEKPAPQEKQPQAQAVEKEAMPAPAAPAVSTGTYVLDAGAFLFASQRDELKKKITALGYKPVVTQVRASVRLLRLRVGSFSKEQLPAALEDVRKIAPGAFSLARDGKHTIYAGSFVDQSNIQRLCKRFLEKGIELVEEPVMVDRDLSRLQFGEFVDDASAEAAAKQAEQAGIPVRVVSK